MARAWGVLWDSWKGGQYACGWNGLWTATLSGRPGNCWQIPWIQIQAAARCARCELHAMSSASSKGEHQYLLREDSFQDHTRWRDHGERRRNSRLPDFRHWVDNWHKPARGDAPVATPGARMDQGTSAPLPWSLSPDYDDHIVEKQFTPESVKKLCQHGDVSGAVAVLEVVAGGSCGIDKYLLYSVLKDCVAKKDLMLGGQLHAVALRMGLGSDTFLCNHFIRMYAGHGKLREAMDVFRGVPLPDAFMWSSIISAHVKQGQAERAIQLYQDMRGMTKPDKYVFVAALQACAAAVDLQSGKQTHSDVLTCGMEHDLFVGNCLVEMYTKCGSLKDARRVFDGLGRKNAVTWTVMITGYAQEGMGQEALNIYKAMYNEGMATPDAVTFVCLLEACAGVGALQQAKQLHSVILEGGLEANEFIGSSLVKTYAKCGHLDVSREIFDRLPTKNLWTWNALLKGYAEHGEGGMAIQCFEELLEQGVEPNKMTYTCLFNACSHAGLVDQGQQYFRIMVEKHGIEPDDQHYNCMVDLLGRSGHLDLAEHMLRTSGVVGNAVSWTSLLSACKSYGDAELGRRCFDQLRKLEPADATAYLLLGSIYANAGRWDEVDTVESLRKAAGARKKPGKACIEVKKEVHEFTVGEDRSDVATALRKMNARVKAGGHVPQTQLVLRAVSEQEKEDALCGHAEKLALAYGLLNTPAGSTLVVTKNLRMCNDCHSSTKVMSRLEKREIVVRDGHKVHRFQNGACSCQDRP